MLRSSLKALVKVMMANRRCAPAVRAHLRIIGFERWRHFTVVSGLWVARRSQLSSRIAGHEIAGTSETARQDVADGFAAWQRHFSAGLQRMQRSGELKAGGRYMDDPATGLLAAVQGGCLLTKTTRDELTMAAALDMTLDRIRGALTAAR